MTENISPFQAMYNKLDLAIIKIEEPDRTEDTEETLSALKNALQLVEELRAIESHHLKNLRQIISLTSDHH